MNPLRFDLLFYETHIRPERGWGKSWGRLWEKVRKVGRGCKEPGVSKEGVRGGERKG